MKELLIIIIIFFILGVFLAPLSARIIILVFVLIYGTLLNLLLGCLVLILVELIGGGQCCVLGRVGEPETVVSEQVGGLIIGGGTAQIQKNIIAERGLEMPREPNPAKTSNAGPKASDMASQKQGAN